MSTVHTAVWIIICLAISSALAYGLDEVGEKYLGTVPARLRTWLVFVVAVAVGGGLLAVTGSFYGWW